MDFVIPIDNLIADRLCIPTLVGSIAMRYLLGRIFGHLCKGLAYAQINPLQPLVASSRPDRGANSGPSA
jgi:hypothetical protein